MDIIQFHCPACRTLLRVPPAAAGFQGPCPVCQRDIVGPVPDKGLEARLAPKDAFTPFPGSPIPTPPQEPESTPAPIAPEPEPEQAIPEPPAPEPTPPAPEPTPPPPEPELPPVEEPAPPEPEPTLPEPESFTPFSDTPKDLAAPPRSTSSEPSNEPATDKPTPKEGPLECLAPKHVRRLRTAVLVLSCLLCSVISYIFGYVMAQKSRDFAAPIFSDPEAILEVTPLPEPPATDPLPEPPPSKPLPEATPETETDPSPLIPPTIEDPEPDAEESSPASEVDLSGEPEPPSSDTAARATLDAFLSAPDWASRSAYVLDADEVRTAMKTHAEEHGDGPMETTAVDSAFVFPDQEHFVVRTTDVPEGFPVTLQQVGPDWRIDWKVFQEFHGDQFRRFASGKLGEEAEFHLYLRPHAKQDANGFTRYQLTAPIKGRSYPAFGKGGSLAQAKITALLDSEEMRSNPDIQELLANDGVPLVLKLSYQSRGKEQNFLLIEDLVAQGWGR